MTLTPRDESLLEALTRKVRFLSVADVCRGWFRRSSMAGRRRLRSLERAGLTRQSRILAQSLPVSDRPVFAWNVGEGAPDADTLSANLRDRWSEPPRTTAIVAATPRAAYLFGGVVGGLRRLQQANHDLYVGAVYVQFLEARPQDARAWLGEDVVPKAGFRRKDPDAVLARRDGTRVAIEIAGCYDAHRIRELHEDFAHRGLPYELW